MAIAKKPDSNSNQTLSNANSLTSEQQSFINGGNASDTQPKRKSKPVMLRVDPEMLKRIDKAAARLGLNRAAFIVSSAVQRVDHLERE